MMLSALIVLVFVFKVIILKVMMLMYDQFWNIAHKIKSVTNEVDEEKMKRIVVEFTIVVMNAINTFFGAQVKTAIIESLKF